MRLINADEYKKILIFLEQDCERYGQIDCAEEIRLVIRQLDNMPIIDAEPVVHAHWIKLDDNGRELAIPYCSQCLHLPLRNNGYAIELTDYCPHCGAKMDEEATK